MCSEHYRFDFLGTGDEASIGSLFLRLFDGVEREGVDTISKVLPLGFFGDLAVCWAVEEGEGEEVGLAGVAGAFRLEKQRVRSAEKSVREENGLDCKSKRAQEGNWAKMRLRAKAIE